MAGPRALGAAARPAPGAYFELAGKAGAWPALDGLRAAAILLVLARHAATSLAPAASDAWALPLRWLHNLALNGWLGVDLFFVLSGCLIGSHLLRWRQFSATPYRFRTYLLKRVCRTFPLYYAVIALILLGLIPLYPSAAGPLDLLVLLLFVQDWFGSNILVPLWSLAVEEKFYLVAPLLVFGLLRRAPGLRAPALLLALAVLAALGRGALVVAAPPDSYADFFWRCRAPYTLEPFLLGVLCAFLAGHDGAVAFARRHARGMTLLPAALLACLFCAQPWVESQDWLGSSAAISVAATAFACLVFAAIAAPGQGSVAGVLGGVPLRAVSRLSYALYLTHYTVIPAALLGAAQLAGAAAGVLHGLAFIALYLGYALLFSLLLHFLVEKPFLLLKDRIG